VHNSGCLVAKPAFPSGSNTLENQGGRMKRFAITLTLIALLIPALAIAGPPLDGVYKSVDVGGTIGTGRYTESWEAGGGPLMPGTTLNAESWDGASLALEWRYWCATLAVAPTLLFDTVNPVTGNGNRSYMKQFNGGYIWLSGTGPWANGDPDYPGTIDTYMEIETIQYVNWVPVHAISNVQATAHFDNYPETCLNFAVANGVEVGSTNDGETKPGDYPDFLEELTCDPVLTLGAWWDMKDLSLAITGCSVPTEEMNWGAIKAHYKE
jgi:hypothetical protein